MEKTEKQIRRKFSKMGNEELFKKLESGTLTDYEHNIAFLVAYQRFGVPSNFVKKVNPNYVSEQLLEAIKQLEVQVRMNTRLKNIAMASNIKHFYEMQLKINQ